MRGRRYSYSPSPPRSYSRRYRSPSPRGRPRYRDRVRDLPTSLLVRNLRRGTRYGLWHLHDFARIRRKVELSFWSSVWLMLINMDTCDFDIFIYFSEDLMIFKVEINSMAINQWFLYAPSNGMVIKSFCCYKWWYVVFISVVVQKLNQFCFLQVWRPSRAFWRIWSS